MGKTGSGSRSHGFWTLAGLVLVAALAPACSDNKGPVGPAFPAGQTGTADTTSQLQVNVTVNPNAVEVGRRAGITVLVTNFNGRPLEGRHVQLDTSAGQLDAVDGFTDSDGKFVTFLFCDTAATVVITAIVEGAIGLGVVTCGAGAAAAAPAGS